MIKFFEKLTGKKGNPTPLTNKQARSVVGGAKEKFEREHPSI